jgi:glycosyltransferase involved in cell wall biosynthesis
MQQEYNYIPLPEPIPITEQIWPEETLPLVSTMTTAYNHGAYIRECIEGLLMQKTTFPVKLIIHDDASTDDTADIIREYEIKYPNLFKIIYQSENQYSQKVDIYNEFLLPDSKGKYIALCEGDDYWTDPLKLQKQVDFLEANPEYGMVFTNEKLYYQTENRFEIVEKYKRSDSDLTLEDELIGNRVGTLTTCFRKNLYHEYFQEIKPDEKGWKMGDYPLWLFITSNTTVRYLTDVTAVYRILDESASRSKSLLKNLIFQISVAQIKEYFANRTNNQELVNEELKLFYYDTFQIFYANKFVGINYKLIKDRVRRDNKLSVFNKIRLWGLKSITHYYLSYHLINFLKRVRKMLLK